MQFRYFAISRDQLTCLAGGLVGAIAFATSLGLRAVDPHFFQWLLHDDWSIHFLGWHLYRAGPWEFPLGSAPLYRAPLGTSVGLTDSLPLFAVFFKLLDPLLPATFQYIGMWLLVCFVLQGVFAVRLMRVATPNRILQLLGATLLVLSPPLLFRVGHPALSAHWLFLAALWLYFDRAANKPDGKLLLWWIVIGGVAAGTHPYMTLMVFGLIGAAYARRVIIRPRDLPLVVMHLTVIVGVALLVIWQAGYFVVGRPSDLDVVGLGFLSMNLLAPVMSFERSTLFPQDVSTPASPWQFEGFAYFGVGMIALAVVGMFAFARSLPRRRLTREIWQYVPLMLVCVSFTLLALSPVITFGPHKLVEYDPGWWGPFTIFRASGRLFWPVFYAISFAILAGLVRLRYRWAAALLVAGLALQAVDVSGMHAAARHYRNFAFDDPLRSPVWRVAAPHYRHLVLVPSNLCDWQGIFDHTPFALLAGEFGLSINAGLTARFDTQKQSEYCAQMRRDLRAGTVSADALYVLRPEVVSRFQTSARSPLVCSKVDGYAVCVVADSYGAWQHDFDVLRSALPTTTELVTFFDALDAHYRDHLERTPFAAVGTKRDRVEAIAAYLAYRWAGCSHDDAEKKTLAQADDGNELRYCMPLVSEPLLPHPADTVRLRQRLEEVLRSEPANVAEPTHIDPEGEAVWLHAYVQGRLSGMNDFDARQQVFRSIATITGR